MQSTSWVSSRTGRRLVRLPKLGEKLAGRSLTIALPPLLVLDFPGTPTSAKIHSHNLVHSPFIPRSVCVCSILLLILGVWGNAASVPSRETRGLEILELQMAGVTSLIWLAPAARRWKLMVCENLQSYFPYCYMVSSPFVYFTVSLPIKTCSHQQSVNLDAYNNNN